MSISDFQTPQGAVPLLRGVECRGADLSEYEQAPLSRTSGSSFDHLRNEDWKRYSLLPLLEAYITRLPDARILPETHAAEDFR